jgi:hypothetical protein
MAAKKAEKHRFAAILFAIIAATIMLLGLWIHMEGEAELYSIPEIVIEHPIAGAGHQGQSR